MAGEAIALVGSHEKLASRRLLRRGGEGGGDGERRGRRGRAAHQLILSAFSAARSVSSCERSSRSRDSAIESS